MKIFLTTNNPEYATWIKGAEIVETIDEADVVMFTGGEDVSPSLYGVKHHHMYTNSNEHRDKIDENFFIKGLKSEKLLVGICRGAQFLTAMSGGKVIQHVNNHARADGHEIKLDSGTIHHITSTHHQMMYPYSAKIYDIIAVSAPPISDVYFKDKVDIYEMVEEPEIVYYPITKSLCIQGHPSL